MIGIFIIYVMNMLKELKFIDKKIDQQLEFIIFSLIYFLYLIIMIIMGTLLYTANGPVFAYYLLFIVNLLFFILFVLIVPFFKELYDFQIVLGTRQRKSLFYKLFFLKKTLPLILILANGQFLPFFVVFFRFDQPVFVNTLILVQLTATAVLLSQSIKIGKRQKFELTNKSFQILLFFSSFFLARYIRSINIVKLISKGNDTIFLMDKKIVQTLPDTFLNINKFGVLVSIIFTVVFLFIKSAEENDQDINVNQYRNSLYATTFCIATLSGFLSVFFQGSQLFFLGVLLSNTLYYTTYFDLFYFGYSLNIRHKIFYMLYISKIPMILVLFIVIVNVCEGYSVSLLDCVFNLLALSGYFTFQSLVIPKILKIITHIFSLEIIWYRRISFSILLVINTLVMGLYNLIYLKVG